MRKQLAIGIGVVVATVTLVGLFYLPLPQAIQGAVRPIATRLHDLGATLRNQVKDLTGGSSAAEIERLQQELRRQRIKTVVAQLQVSELEELRQELGVVDEGELDYLVVPIMNYQPHPARQMVRIAAGSKHGIKVDMPVVAEGVLVGVVEEVGNKTADVLLIHDSRFRALAEISGSDISGVVRGQVGDGARLEQVPAEAELTSGDTIITSGLDGVFPRGILIGSVAGLLEGHESVFVQSAIEHPVDYRARHSLKVLLYE